MIHLMSDLDHKQTKLCSIVCSRSAAIHLKEESYEKNNTISIVL